ncbi:MAG: hypothetical protein AAGF11_29190 [Myxococcota bacterium]
MNDTTKINPQVVDALNATATATMSTPVVRTSGAGKAYQSVAQSTALAIQDATDNLRNMSLVSSTATGVALSQILATGELSPYTEVLLQAQALMESAVKNFGDIGQSAAQILREFPTS